MQAPEVIMCQPYDVWATGAWSLGRRTTLRSYQNGPEKAQEVLFSAFKPEERGSKAVCRRGIAVAVDLASDTMGALDGNEVLYSEIVFANAGVLVLREMAKAWWAEACRGFTMADVMEEMDGHSMIYQLVDQQQKLYHPCHLQKTKMEDSGRAPSRLAIKFGTPKGSKSKKHNSQTKPTSLGSDTGHTPSTATPNPTLNRSYVASTPVKTLEMERKGSPRFPNPPNDVSKYDEARLNEGLAFADQTMRNTQRRIRERETKDSPATTPKDKDKKKGDFQPPSSVCVAHIVRHSVGDVAAESLFGKPSHRRGHIWNLANGIPMRKVYEEALDKANLVIVPGDTPRSWKVCCLQARLAKEAAAWDNGDDEEIDDTPSWSTNVVGIVKQDADNEDGKDAYATSPTKAKDIFN
ncbi:hypothetical protein QBC33DRAFT_603630 [Phialemonium atrogriseum]|uniref:HNH nuclease domain-containing protein n=1 Tax=Phialemonium atrogriseum TaxID=1093897 RepID=A0AAJ0BRX1_9PEZI|nr:uncharacterized protein QBC33DRAFT_603630 [Phialemonium atrogriseum]KAK1761902.1 hypothetical protein QBC33DRAFT_603630 [Phialemonium atrogriseum]